MTSTSDDVAITSPAPIVALVVAVLIGRRSPRRAPRCTAGTTSRRYRWLGTAGALILVFVVGVSFYFEATHVAAIRRIFFVGKAAAKSSLPHATYPIRVFNSAYQIQSPNFPKNIVDFLSVQNAVTNVARQSNAASQCRECGKASDPYSARRDVVIGGRCGSRSPFGIRIDW